MELFHPAVSQWFVSRFERPMPIQLAAWEAISASRHVLISASTGSGKTLAAFLWSINEFLQRDGVDKSAGGVDVDVGGARAAAAGRAGAGQALARTAGGAQAGRVLYVSPLKALNNDIQRNLLTPLAEIRSQAQVADIGNISQNKNKTAPTTGGAQNISQNPSGSPNSDQAEAPTPLPAVSVGVRSGDSTSSERNAIMRYPPDIFITTPEAINIMLTSERGRLNLSSISTVIVDEIHTLAASKRGALFMANVERLEELALSAGGRGLQRIALSATVRPIERVAEFLGGFEGDVRRSVAIVRDSDVGGAGGAGWREGSAGRGEAGGSGGAGADGRRAGAGKIEQGGGDVPQNLRNATRHSAETPAGQADISTTLNARGARKRYELEIRLAPSEEKSWWDRQIPLIASEIDAHTCTVLFCNSRRASEKAAYLLNNYYGEKRVFAHHGSLSREYRYWVEQELKEGRLSAVAATASLELGIDIGAIDRVLLIQPSFSLSSAIQRVGRSNHQVNEVPSAAFIPLHPRDILKSLAQAEAIEQADIEPIRIPQNPLDVLAQIILSETAGRSLSFNDLKDVIRRTGSFHSLSDSDFDNVVNMLCGLYEHSRVRELQPRIRQYIEKYGEEHGEQGSERYNNRHQHSEKQVETKGEQNSRQHQHGEQRGRRMLEGKEGNRYLIYQSGGTIPDRGYFDLRISGSEEKIGDLDEEFVFERSLNDRFTLGNKVWKIDKIDNQKVLVSPSNLSSLITPFWKADQLGADDYTSEKYNVLLEHLNERIGQFDSADVFAKAESQAALHAEPARAPSLSPHAEHAPPPATPPSISPYIDSESERELMNWLRAQKNFTGTDLPHRRHILIEELADPSITPDTIHYIIHNNWGASVNAGLLFCLQAKFKQREAASLEGFYTDDSVVLSLPLEYSSAESEAQGYGERALAGSGRDRRSSSHQRSFSHQRSSLHQRSERFDVLQDIQADEVPALIREQIVLTGLFGSHFRRNAARALLVLRKGFSQRTPLWLQRMKTRQLFERVIALPNFPITQETLREILEQYLSVEKLQQYISEVNSGSIRLSRILSRTPSPFASDLLWQLNNEYLYKEDSLSSTLMNIGNALAGGALGAGALSGGALSGSEILGQFFNGQSIEIPEEIQRLYLLKRRRLLEEYRPESDEDIRFYFQDRRMFTEEERRELSAVVNCAEIFDSLFYSHSVGVQGDVGERGDITGRRVSQAQNDVAEKGDITEQGRSQEQTAGAEQNRTLEQERPLEQNRPQETRQSRPLYFNKDIQPQLLEDEAALCDLAVEWFDWQAMVLHSDAVALWGQAVIASLLRDGQLTGLVLPQGEYCLSPNVLDRLLRMRRNWKRDQQVQVSGARLQYLSARLNAIRIFPLAEAEEEAGDAEERRGSEVHQQEGNWRKSEIHQQEHEADPSDALAQLIGTALPLSALLRGVLPARLGRIDPQKMEGGFRQLGMLWTGLGGDRVVLATESDCAQWIRAEDVQEAKAGEKVSREPSGGTEAREEPSQESSERAGEQASEKAKTEPREIVLEGSGRYNFHDLIRRYNSMPKEMHAAILRSVQASRIANDSFLALLELHASGGIQRRRKAPEVPSERRSALSEKRAAEQGRQVERQEARLSSSQSYGQQRWLGSRLGYARRGNFRLKGSLRETHLQNGTIQGLFLAVPAFCPPDNPEELQEALRGYIYQLLERHPLLNKDIVNAERTGYKWHEILPVLRRMELSGELIGGKICPDLMGLQFCPADVDMSTSESNADVLANGKIGNGIANGGIAGSGEGTASDARSNPYNAPPTDERYWFWLNSYDPALIPTPEQVKKSSNNYMLFLVQGQNAEPCIRILNKGREIEINEELFEISNPSQTPSEPHKNELSENTSNRARDNSTTNARIAGIIHRFFRTVLLSGSEQSAFITRINATPAVSHHLCDPLKNTGFMNDPQGLKLWKY